MDNIVGIARNMPAIYIESAYILSGLMSVFSFLFLFWREGFGFIKAYYMEIKSIQNLGLFVIVVILSIIVLFLIGFVSDLASTFLLNGFAKSVNYIDKHIPKNFTKIKKITSFINHFLWPRSYITIDENMIREDYRLEVFKKMRDYFKLSSKCSTQDISRLASRYLGENKHTKSYIFFIIDKSLYLVTLSAFFQTIVYRNWIYTMVTLIVMLIVFKNLKYQTFSIEESNIDRAYLSIIKRGIDKSVI